jgi:hypothetical protein
MIERRRRWNLAAAMFGALGALAMQPAGAVRVDGLGPIQAVAGEQAEVQVRAGVLRIAVSQGAPITIAPWPGYLPQRFAAQRVHATRALHPAGPTDRVELRELAAADPWLIVVSGLRAGDAAVGNWRLERSDGRWILRNERAWRMLRPGGQDGRAAEIRVKGGRWCVHLLETQDSAPDNGALAQESEPQVALAAVRQTGNCRASSGGH